MTTTDGETPQARLTRLDALAGELETALGTHATVERKVLADGKISTVSIRPERPHALGVVWIVMGPDEVVLQAGHRGGRWELELATADIDFLEEVTRSVVAGRAAEVFAWRRSRVEVTLSDGRVVREDGREGLQSLVPLPAWRRWGRRVQYNPYQ